MQRINVQCAEMAQFVRHLDEELSIDKKVIQFLLLLI